MCYSQWDFIIQELQFWEWQKEIWQINNPAFWKNQNVTYAVKLELIGNMRKKIPVIKKRIPPADYKIGSFGKGELDPGLNDEQSELMKRLIGKIQTSNSDFSTPPIPTKQLSDSERLSEIKNSFRILMKRKLEGEKNWKDELIPSKVYYNANKMWKEAKMRPHAIDKKDWTEYLEFKDYEKIFCHHCRIVSTRHVRI